LIVFTPVPISWFLWIVPFIVIQQIYYKTNLNILILLLGLIIVLYDIVFNNTTTNYIFDFNSNVKSIFYTFVTSGFLILMLKIFILGVKKNDIYNVSKKPILIGLDSGLLNINQDITNSILGLFDKRSVTNINEDNYRFIKSKNVNNKNTNNHYDLDKLSNELLQYSSSKHNYETILVSGHHIFMQNFLRKSLNVKIHIREGFNEKQNNVDDNCISIYLEKNSNQSYIMRLVKNQGIFTQSLLRVLVGICNLHINYDFHGKNAIIDIDGEVDRKDIELSAKYLIPDVEELLAFNPLWMDNHIGVIQLIMLLKIKESFLYSNN
jgi:hypothetical protein